MEQGLPIECELVSYDKKGEVIVNDHAVVSIFKKELDQIEALNRWLVFKIYHVTVEGIQNLSESQCFLPLDFYNVY